MKTWVWIGAMALLTASSLAWAAEGISMTPGKWEMKMTMEMSMLPQPQTHTSTECITEAELNPQNFNMDQNSPCERGEPEIDGNTVRWDISCTAPAGPMTGSWEFTSTGDSVTGKGSMTANMAGQTMEFTMNWEGHRIGDCD